MEAEEMRLMHDPESGEPYWVTKKEYDDYHEMRDAFLAGISKRLAESGVKSAPILVSTMSLDQDDKIKEMWDNYDHAKKELSSMLGIPSSRENGMVQYFQPTWPAAIDKFGSQE
jgi:hypothetical protein